MKILKIIEISSKDSCDESKEIKQEINNYWRKKTQSNEAKEFAESFGVLDNEYIGRLIITQEQASWNPAFANIYKTLKNNDAQELHYYFHKH